MGLALIGFYRYYEVGTEVGSLRKWESGSRNAEVENRKWL